MRLNVNLAETCGSDWRPTDIFCSDNGKLPLIDIEISNVHLPKLLKFLGDRGFKLRNLSRGVRSREAVDYTQYTEEHFQEYLEDENPDLSDLRGFDITEYMPQAFDPKTFGPFLGFNEDLTKDREMSTVLHDYYIRKSSVDGKVGELFVNNSMLTLVHPTSGTLVGFKLGTVDYTENVLICGESSGLISQIEAVCIENQIFYEKEEESPHQPDIFIITKMYGKLQLHRQRFRSRAMDEIELQRNYGKNFMAYYKKIMTELDNATGGLHIISGPAGTGKTSFIKHLIQASTSSNFLFIPSGLVENLEGPELITMLLRDMAHGCTLVIEDAEQAVTARDKNLANSNLVSTLLNLSDGILGDALNITIIVTFNTDIQNIDKALLRNGRLRTKHNFKELELSDAIEFVKGFYSEKDNVDNLINYLKECGDRKRWPLCDLYALEDDCPRS